MKHQKYTPQAVRARVERRERIQQSCIRPVPKEEDDLEFYILVRIGTDPWRIGVMHTLPPYTDDPARLNRAGRERWICLPEGGTGLARRFKGHRSSGEISVIAMDYAEFLVPAILDYDLREIRRRLEGASYIYDPIEF